MTLKEWLESDKCKALNVQPVRVKIGTQEWDGCRYKQLNTYTAGMDGVRWGKFKAGDTYESEAIYLLGGLPKVYNPRPKNKTPRGRVCFPFEGLEWYVAGYIKEIPPGFEWAHPFGPSFILCPWDIPNSSIDDGERKPYERHLITVTPI